MEPVALSFPELPSLCLDVRATRSAMPYLAQLFGGRRFNGGLNPSPAVRPTPCLRTSDLRNEGRSCSFEFRTLFPSTSDSSKSSSIVGRAFLLSSASGCVALGRFDASTHPRLASRRLLRQLRRLLDLSSTSAGGYAASHYIPLRIGGIDRPPLLGRFVVPILGYIRFRETQWVRFLC